MFITIVINMLEKLKVYILYKSYSSLITKNFIKKDIQKMSQSQLFKYFLKLKNDYNYSKSCYKLRIKYRDLYIKKENQDANHDIAIEIVKKYNTDVFETIKKIQTLLKPKNEYNYHVSNIFNLININTNENENNQENEKNESDKDKEKITVIKSKSKSKKSKSKSKKNKNKKDEIQVQILKDIEDDKYLNDIFVKKQQLNIEIYIILAEKLEEYNLKYNDHEIFFLNQEICLKHFNSSFSMLYYLDKELLIEKIKKMCKLDLVKFMINVKKQFKTNFYGNVKDIICIKVKFGGVGGIGEFTLFIDKNLQIINLLNSFMFKIIQNNADFIKENMIDHYPVFSTKQNYKHDKFLFNPNSYIKDIITDNQVIYFHNYCCCCYPFDKDAFNYDDFDSESNYDSNDDDGDLSLSIK